MIRWPVYKGRLRVAWLLVDDADLHLVEPYLWRRHPYGYPCRYGADGKTVLLHRALFGLVPGDGQEADHINGDPLDNRRENLRVCTRAQNGQNMPSRAGTSRFRGVSWNTRLAKWVAQGKVNGTVHYLGRFDSETEAAQVAAAWRGEHLPFTNVARDVCPDFVREEQPEEVVA